MSNNHPVADEKIRRVIEILLDQIKKGLPNQSELSIDPAIFYSGIPTLEESELMKILRDLTFQGLLEKVSMPIVPLQIEPNVKPEVHKTIVLTPKPLQLLEYLRKMENQLHYAEWERSDIGRRELTKDEILNKIKDFSENFPMYHELPEKHYMYEVRFKEFIARLHKQFGLSDEIRNHALAVFNESYVCPGYPGYNKLFDRNTNIYGQRYIGIRFYVLPLIWQQLEEQLSEEPVSLAHAKSLEQDTKHIFRFGSSVTDFRYYRICKEGEEEKGQTMNTGKRRFIWRFCWEYCDKGFQTQEHLNAYVSQKLGRPEKVTNDDIKTLIDLIARFSGVSSTELRKEYIRFVIGSGIEVKNIP